MKLIIDRSRWLRGGKNGRGRLSASTLCDSSGHMCCLGFYGEQLGCPLEGGDPEHELDEDTGKPHANWPRWLVKENLETDADDGIRSYLTGACKELINVNDLENILAESRESRIAALFAENGVEVTFVDKVEP